MWYSFLVIVITLFIYLSIIISFFRLNKKSAYLLSLIFFVFVISLVFFKRIISGDSIEYQYRFLTDVNYYISEPIFYILTNISQQIIIEPISYIYFLICIILTLNIIFSFIVFRKDFVIYMLFLLSNSFFMINLLGVYRSGIAIPLSLLSLFLFVRKRYLLSFVFLAIAYLCHNSSLIILFVLFTYLYANKLNIKKIKVITSIICLYVVVSFSFMTNPFGSFLTYIADLMQAINIDQFSRYSRYLTVSAEMFNNSSGDYLIKTAYPNLDIVLQVVISYFIFFVFCKNKISSNIKSWFILYYISLIPYLLIIGQAFSYRLYMVSSYIFIVFISYAFLTITESKNKAFIFILCFILFCVSTLYSVQPEKIGLIYFKF